MSTSKSGGELIPISREGRILTADPAFATSVQFAGINSIQLSRPGLTTPFGSNVASSPRTTLSLSDEIQLCVN
jgi:hypothetical protein